MLRLLICLLTIPSPLPPAVVGCAGVRVEWAGGSGGVGRAVRRRGHGRPALSRFKVLIATTVHHCNTALLWGARRQHRHPTNPPLSHTHTPPPLPPRHHHLFVFSCGWSQSLLADSLSGLKLNPPPTCDPAPKYRLDHEASPLPQSVQTDLQSRAYCARCGGWGGAVSRTSDTAWPTPGKGRCGESSRAFWFAAIDSLRSQQRCRQRKMRGNKQPAPWKRSERQRPDRVAHSAAHSQLSPAGPAELTIPVEYRRPLHEDARR